MKLLILTVIMAVCYIIAIFFSGIPLLVLMCQIWLVYFLLVIEIRGGHRR